MSYFSAISNLIMGKIMSFQCNMQADEFPYSSDLSQASVQTSLLSLEMEKSLRMAWLCDTPACLCAELGSLSLSLCVLFMRRAQPDSGLKTSPGLLMRLQYDLLDRHIAINGFPEKIPKHIIHLFKCTRGWLCFLTRLLVVSCLGSLWRVHQSFTLYITLSKTRSLWLH